MYTLDDLSDALKRDILCIQIAKFTESFTEPDVYALLLGPTGVEEDQYKRVGIARIPEDNGIADGWDVSTVTIV
jgi:hypothetical protein